MLSVLYPVIPVFKFNFEPQPSCSYVCSYVTYEYEVGFKVTRVVHTDALIQSLELALQSFDSIPSAPELCLAVKNPALLQHKPAAVSSACLSWHTPACLAWVQHRPFWIKIVICLLTGVHSSFHGLQNHRPKGLFFFLLIYGMSYFLLILKVIIYVAITSVGIWILSKNFSTG